MIISDKLIYALMFASTLGCGLNAGLFFIFSNTIMGALARLKSSEGVVAMQSINRVILNPFFFIVFFGTAVTCFLLALFIVGRWQYQNAIYIFTGSLFYLLGCILVTIVCNVPRNEALDVLDPKSDEATDLWTRYLKEWTAWNHVRTISCVLGAVSFIIAISK